MKKILLFALSLLVVVACSKFDDSAIWEELNKHEDRIVKLETLCNQMNTNITSLQTIIIALQSNDYVVNIAPIMEGNKEIGYTITFAKSGSITIYHGKDGENGKDGANGTDGKDGQDGKDGVDGKDAQDGKDGKDGYTPKIGAKQHSDGKYYWTIDGDWILDDNNNMIPVTGEDGKDGKDGANGADGKDGQNGKDGEDGKDGQDGEDGKDGITPQLKIEDGYWYLSYDNGATWQKLGKATGNNGLDGLPGADGADGEDGDNIIDSITQDEDNVYFNLSDGQVLTIQKSLEKIIHFSDINVKLICLEHWDTNEDCEISFDEASAITSLDGAFEGSDIIIFNEYKYFTSVPEVEANSFSNCKSLRYITFPPQVHKISDNAFSGCTSLKKIHIPETVTEFGESVFSGSALEIVNIPDGVTRLTEGLFKSCKNLKEVVFGKNSKLKNVGGIATGDDGTISGWICSGAKGAFSYCTSLQKIDLPLSVEVIEEGAFWGCTNLTYINLEMLNNLKAIKGGRYAWSASNVSGVSYCGAFTECTSLEKICIPASVKELGYALFVKTSVKIYMMSSTPCSISSKDTFASYSQNIQPAWTNQRYFSVCVPAGSKDVYKSATGWSGISLVEYDASELEE